MLRRALYSVSVVEMLLSVTDFDGQSDNDYSCLMIVIAAKVLRISESTTAMHRKSLSSRSDSPIEITTSLALRLHRIDRLVDATSVSTHLSASLLVCI